jgi:hypothetical protein
VHFSRRASKIPTGEIERALALTNNRNAIGGLCA